MTTQAEIDLQIDQWVGSDPDSVGRILEALVLAVHRTAVHAEANWQDKRTARVWDHIGEKIEKAEHFFKHNKPY